MYEFFWRYLPIVCNEFIIWHNHHQIYVFTYKATISEVNKIIIHIRFMQFFTDHYCDEKRTFYFFLVFYAVAILTTQYVKSFTIDRNWESQSFTFSQHRCETSGGYRDKSSRPTKETNNVLQHSDIPHLPNVITFVSRFFSYENALFFVQWFFNTLLFC